MPKLSIILGAVSSDSVSALVISKGLDDVPHVTLRDAGAHAGHALSPVRLPVGELIRERLDEINVRVYRVDATISSAHVIEAHGGNAKPVKTSPFRPLPNSLADAPGGLSFVLATCTYYWEPYLNRLAQRFREANQLGTPPLFAVLAGDNIYLDLPKPRGQKPADVVDRYLQYFLYEGYAEGRASMPSFTTYDDHEYWNNYPELALPVAAWLSDSERGDFEGAADECLALFQRSINPPPIDGASFTYRIDIPPLSICVVDARTNRYPVGDESPQLMPEADLNTLEEWARGLEGPGVFVIGQPLWIEPIHRFLGFPGDHNVSYFKAQYNRICKALEDAPFDVLICSGDVHYSRLLKILTPNGRTLHEVVVSPLVSIPTMTAGAWNVMSNVVGKPELNHKIADTKCPPHPGWHAHYQMGTANGTTFAVINFKPAGAGVVVGMSFIDLDKGGPVDMGTHVNLGNAELSTPQGQRPVCAYNSAFTLGKRLI